MEEAAPNPMSPDAGEVSRALIQVGVYLSSMPDRRQMLDLILLESRKLARAEAGSLYILRKGELRFAVAQNDRLDMAQLVQVFRDKQLPTQSSSLAGYVAATATVLNIPDADALPADAPFRINRDFDRTSGYHTQSILALPLMRPDGQCVGVLQLLNRHAADGAVEPFPSPDGSGLASLASMAAVTIHNALLQEELKAAHLDTIIRLASVVEYHDNDTAHHIRRVSRTAGLLARAMGLDARQVELLEYASPMHDIGKVGVPDTILRKPGPLTPEERLSMERHPGFGAEILGQATDDLIATAHDIALSHHERWDGTGYPQHLAGPSIPLCGRIACVADVVDALLSVRAYKSAFDLGTVLGILKSERGRQFDPAVIDAFFRAQEEILTPYGLTPPPTTAAEVQAPASKVQG